MLCLDFITLPQILCVEHDYIITDPKIVTKRKYLLGRKKYGGGRWRTIKKYNYYYF